MQHTIICIWVFMKTTFSQIVKLQFISISDEPIDLKMSIWGPMEPASFASLRQPNIDLFLSPNIHKWRLMDFMDFSFPYICEYELEDDQESSTF